MAAALSELSGLFANIDTSRWEYYDGRLRERPVPSPEHSKVQSNLCEFLGPMLRPHGYRTRSELTVDKEKQPYSQWMTPDVLVVRSGVEKAVRGVLPEQAYFVFEILSSGQSFPSMEEKLEVMQRWNVYNACVIDPQSQKVRVYRTSFETLGSAMSEFIHGFISHYSELSLDDFISIHLPETTIDFPVRLLFEE